ncbi:MAG: hypothetical protein SFV21_00205 [Rhodospirillaceae bacterium]|nr:hypothetical protein [Rhodospirillaceae bacterium]
MPISIKPGVRLHGLRPEMAVAVTIVNGVLAEIPVKTVITSAIDGRHGHGSLHFVGAAIDIRSREIPPARLAETKDKLAAALGPDFDVVLEPDHFHIEFQPKTPYGA